MRRWHTAEARCSSATESSPSAQRRPIERNDGATISQTDAERVFEPFWRGDAARTVERGHCGLGLPLVRRLVAVLKGSVSVSVKDGRFTVLLVLPPDLR